MPTWCDQGGEKGVPIIGVDYDYLWSRAPEASDAQHDEVAGEDPPDGVRTSSPVLCGRCSVDRLVLWSSLPGKRGQRAESCRCWQRSCKLGGYPRDGELALLAHVRARAMTMGGRCPARISTRAGEQGAESREWACRRCKSKSSRPRFVLLRRSTEMGLGRRILETHHWLVTHAAATINWFRPGLDGKTPCELRLGRKFRRPVAPWGQNVWWMSAEKHVSRISAES